MIKQKLIEQYKQRIARVYDPLIEGIVDDMKALRENDNYTDSEDWKELQTERKIKMAERQCYVQFISDLEWELDKAECHLYIDPDKSCQALKDRRWELVKK